MKTIKFEDLKLTPKEMEKIIAGARKFVGPEPEDERSEAEPNLVERRPLAE